jgi:tetratricopeptide (TPR) repeat protein
MKWYPQFFSNVRIISQGVNHTGSLSSQARWYSNSTCYARLNIAKKQLDRIAWMHGVESPTYAEQLNNYGVTLQLAGYKEQAFQALKTALQTKIRLYGVQHPDLASTYANLASLFAESNRYVEAIEFYEKAIELKQTAFGYHPEIALFKSNLASVYFKQGDGNQAKLLLEQAYTSLLKTYGESDERTVQVKTKLNAYEAQRQVTISPDTQTSLFCNDP